MRRFVFCLIGTALLVGCLSAALPARAQMKDDQEIRALEDQFAAAASAKDLDAIMKVYVPGNDLFVFDVGVPRQHVGWEDYKKDWHDFLAMFPGPIKFTVSDLSVMSDGKIGLRTQHPAFIGSDGGWDADGHDGSRDRRVPQDRREVADRAGACVGAD